VRSGPEPARCQWSVTFHYKRRRRALALLADGPAASGSCLGAATPLRSALALLRRGGGHHHAAALRGQQPGPQCQPIVVTAVWTMAADADGLSIYSPDREEEERGAKTKEEAAAAAAAAAAARPAAGRREGEQGTNRWGLTIALMIVGASVEKVISLTCVSVETLAALAITGDATISTLPASSRTVGSVLASGPASCLMHKFGRRLGFVAGGVLDLCGSLTCTLALLLRSFPLLCLGTALIGAGSGFSGFVKCVMHVCCGRAIRMSWCSVGLEFTCGFQIGVSTSSMLCDCDLVHAGAGTLRFRWCQQGTPRERFRSQSSAQSLRLWPVPALHKHPETCYLQHHSWLRFC
jgi:hypothetical protein